MELPLGFNQHKPWSLRGEVVPTGICPECGDEVLSKKGRGRPRKFCSERCTEKHNSRVSYQKLKERNNG